MEEAIRIFVAVNFLIIGLSHIFQHRVWAEFFIRLHDKGRAGAFFNGLLSLMMGTLIVAFHNVWTWPAALLTALGWSYILKAAVAFLRPDWALKSMAGIRLYNSHRLILPGLLMVAIAIALGYSIWASQHDVF